MKTKHIYITLTVLLSFGMSTAQTLEDYLAIAKQNSSEIKEQNFACKGPITIRTQCGVKKG